MTVELLLEFAVLMCALFMGTRAGGVALALWGAAGRCSRTSSGLEDRNAVNHDTLGFISGMEFSPQKASVLLMLGLTETSDVKQLQ